MTTKNDITGDAIRSKSGGKDYNDGWDKIWNQKQKQKSMTELNYDGDFRGWSHFCEQEKTLLEVESGYPCNWCGKKELDI